MACTNILRIREENICGLESKTILTVRPSGNVKTEGTASSFRQRQFLGILVKFFRILYPILRISDVVLMNSCMNSWRGGSRTRYELSRKNYALIRIPHDFFPFMGFS